MKLRVVLVEPVHDVNVGSVARACVNFGVDELVLVRPEAKLGLQARKYAKHAFPLLEKAKRAQTVSQATRGCTLVVGTTGVVKRFGKRSVKKCVSVEDLRSKISENDRVALVFGNEGRGLSERDLLKCDFIAFVPTCDEYPVLNLSHAVAVVLYELTKKKKELFATAPLWKERCLEKMMADAARLLPTVHDEKKVSLAFSRVLRRARLADDEAQALFAFFSGIKASTSRLRAKTRKARVGRAK